MKIALISTTIYASHVFELYRKFGKDVSMIIAGDTKTPDDRVRQILKPLGDARYLSVADQQALNYKSSDVIGWGSIQRRNIALLEAIRTKADIIISIDDDNIPTTADYFEQFSSVLSRPYSGLGVSSRRNWFDVGMFLVPPTPHRGFPYSLRHLDPDLVVSPLIDASVGVAAGLWLGDPDIDAMTRIANRPMVYNMGEQLRSGLAVLPGCFTPFNSQNTAYLAELAPLMMVWIGVGRYDDIWASYVAERVMMETKHVVHYGKPYVWQERNQQNLFKNLKDEIFGMETTDRFVADLLNIDVGKGSTIERLRRIYRGLSKADYIPEKSKLLGDAWCDDVERVLS